MLHSGNRVQNLTSRPSVDLEGPEGNAHYILAMAQVLCKQLKDVDAGKYNWDKIHAEMTSGDYNNLVLTFENYFGEFVDIYSKEKIE